jgi:hypothetical protein
MISAEDDIFCMSRKQTVAEPNKEEKAEPGKDMNEHLSAFLTGLPSFKQDNFSRFSPDGTGSISAACQSGSYTSRRPSVYICTKDYPAGECHGQADHVKK